MQLAMNVWHFLPHALMTVCVLMELGSLCAGVLLWNLGLSMENIVREVRNSSCTFSTNTYADSMYYNYSKSDTLFVI